MVMVMVLVHCTMMLYNMYSNMIYLCMHIINGYIIKWVPAVEMSALDTEGVCMHR